MATQAKRDYYEVLGITRAASEQEIMSAFEKLAADFKASGKPRNIAEVEEIRAVATTFRVLSDAKKRRRYDQFGQEFIGDDDNQLASFGQEKLDRLLEWIERRR